LHRRAGTPHARGALPLLLAAGLVAVAAGEAAVAAKPAASDALRDFMIQNVCLDGSGAVAPGRSPLDGAAGCGVQRDLLPGELLPYHKHDHPSPSEHGGVPEGYQRHDSFPVDTAGLGVVVEHSFDFGAGAGRRFGVFDAGSDGGDIAVLSPEGASIGATEDGGAGFQLFAGECRGPLGAAALARSWIIAALDRSPAALLAGETVARLKDLRGSEQQNCPSRLNAAYTRWRVVPFRLRAAAGQGAPITLDALISEHYGGADPATADHVERFYFTRELGGTRWERWQNAAGNALYSAGKIADMAARFAATGRCSAADPPAGGAPFVLVDCREWTRIVPPAAPAGDRAGFFLDAVRTRPGTPAFFAAPAARR
jgi:hypothetical protein